MDRHNVAEFGRERFRDRDLIWHPSSVEPHERRVQVRLGGGLDDNASVEQWNRQTGHEGKDWAWRSDLTVRAVLDQLSEGTDITEVGRRHELRI
jgi:hypothetical protein